MYLFVSKLEIVDWLSNPCKKSLNVTVGINLELRQIKEVPRMTATLLVFLEVCVDSLAYVV